MLEVKPAHWLRKPAPGGTYDCSYSLPKYQWTWALMRHLGGDFLIRVRVQHMNRVFGCC